MSCPSYRQNSLIQKKGFTLIELLIAIAILGVLTAIALSVINPTERLAQSRDTGRISSVTQLGRAISTYYTDRGSYPATSTWAQELIDIGAITTFPSGIPYNAYSMSPCSTFVQPGTDGTYCYDLDTVYGAFVYAVAESLSENENCTAPEIAYFVYSVTEGHSGTICSDGDPSPWATGTQTYVD